MRTFIQALCLLLLFNASLVLADDSQTKAAPAESPAAESADSGSADEADVQVSNPEAKAALEQWLELVDAGNVKGSLNATSEYFQERVDLENWQQAMELNRAPLGEVIRREPESASSRANIPGGPEGAYMVYKFKSVFDNKQESIETITMVQEQGDWRVIGYFIE